MSGLMFQVSEPVRILLEVVMNHSCNWGWPLPPTHFSCFAASESFFRSAWGVFTYLSSPGGNLSSKVAFRKLNWASSCQGCSLSPRSPSGASSLLFPLIFPPSTLLVKLFFPNSQMILKRRQRRRSRVGRELHHHLYPRNDK